MNLLSRSLTTTTRKKVVGYSQDYPNAIVEAVKKKLNKPDLQVKLALSPQNRIPAAKMAPFAVRLNH